MGLSLLTPFLLCFLLQVPAPARAEVAVMAEGRELILVLERNQ